jgi:Lrp/AsnC family transcriptional regulator, leucine-responsive regulatory protein
MTMKTGDPSLDGTDIRILQSLLENARLTHGELASKVSLSATACARRVQRLTERGIVRRFRAELDRAMLGYAMLVIVRITLERQNEECLKAFEKAVVRCGSVLSCYLMSGTADYLITVAARDIADYERAHNNELSRLPHVARIESSFALREVINRELAPHMLGSH